MVDLLHEFLCEIRLGEIDNIGEIERLPCDTVAVLIHWQAQTAPYLLQLADLAAARAQFRDGEDIRIVPALLERPFGEQEPAHIVAAIRPADRQKLFLSVKDLLHLTLNLGIALTMILREITAKTAGYVREARLEIGAILVLFRRKISEQLLHLPPQRPLKELPQIRLLALRAAKRRNIIDKEERERLDLERAAEVLPLHLEMALQSKVEHGLLI